MSRPLDPVATRPVLTLLPVLALVYNASAWGLSWWPFRHFQAQGLHPLWATFAIYGLSVLAIAGWRPAAWGQVLRAPALWLVALASGATNAAFNWGVSSGDVVRVVLLFYLMPLWALTLAWWLLGERLGRIDLLLAALAVGGAALVLWPAEGAPAPLALSDWLGLLGGLAFACNNVLLRRERRRPEEGRALAMFLGSMATSGLLAATLGAAGQVPWPVPPVAAGLLLMAAMAAIFLSSNLALQYGAAHLPVKVTAVVMLTEVVVAAASALWIAGEAPTPRTLAGGALILGAALLSALAPAQPH
ncbi:MAG TPA: DMT family transporter [Burkholderiaceae bacterium]|nr:DMT family transporter [Burkholderiaceae bacterium]